MPSGSRGGGGAAMIEEGCLLACCTEVGGRLAAIEQRGIAYMTLGFGGWVRWARKSRILAVCARFGTRTGAAGLSFCLSVCPVHAIHRGRHDGTDGIVQGGLGHLAGRRVALARLDAREDAATDGLEGSGRWGESLWRWGWAARARGSCCSWAARAAVVVECWTGLYPRPWMRVPPQTLLAGHYVMGSALRCRVRRTGGYSCSWRSVPLRMVVVVEVGDSHFATVA